MKKKGGESMELVKKFWEEEDGMGTVEIVMIIAALMCVALLFRSQIIKFVQAIIGQTMDETLVEAPSDPGIS